jgi:hypothetical protein
VGGTEGKGGGVRDSGGGRGVGEWGVGWGSHQSIQGGQAHVPIIRFIFSSGGNVIKLTHSLPLPLKARARALSLPFSLSIFSLFHSFDCSSFKKYPLLILSIVSPICLCVSVLSFLIYLVSMNLISPFLSIS